MPVIEGNTKPANTPFTTINPSGIDPGQSLQVLNEVKQGEEQRRLEREKMAMESRHKDADRAAQADQATKDREAQTGIAQQRITAEQQMETQRLQNQQMLQDKQLKQEAEWRELDRKHMAEVRKKEYELKLLEQAGPLAAAGANVDAAAKKVEIARKKQELQKLRDGLAAVSTTHAIITGQVKAELAGKMAHDVAQGVAAKHSTYRGIASELRDLVSNVERGREGETVKNPDGTYDMVSSRFKGQVTLGSDQNGPFVTDMQGNKHYKADGAGMANQYGMYVERDVPLNEQGGYELSRWRQGSLFQAERGSLGLKADKIAAALTKGTKIAPADMSALIALAERAHYSKKPEDLKPVSDMMMRMVGPDGADRRDLSMRLTLAQKLSQGLSADVEAGKMEANAGRMGAGEEPIKFGVQTGTQPATNLGGGSKSLAAALDVLGNLRDEKGLPLLPGYGSGFVEYAPNELDPDVPEARVMTMVMQRLFGAEDITQLQAMLDGGVEPGPDAFFKGGFAELNLTNQMKEDIMQLVRDSAQNQLVLAKSNPALNEGLERVKKAGGVSAIGNIESQALGLDEEEALSELEAAKRSHKILSESQQKMQDTVKETP